MRFSASMMKTWSSCQLKAHYKSILDIKEPQHAKTTFGTCIHSALETYNNTGDVELAVEKFKTMWEDPSEFGADIDVYSIGSSWAELNKRGIDFVYKFADENQWETRKIIGAEVPFNVAYGDHRLSGYIDSLEIVGSGKTKELRIIDYKTSSITPTHLKLRFDLQFTSYIWATLQPEFWEDIENGPALYEELKGVRRRGVWYAIWSNKTLDVGPREEKDFERLYRGMLSIANAIEKEVYVPDLTGEACLYCAYLDLCAVTIPLAEEVRVELASRQKKS
jgi:CRISPR/Cas system-associated exonuclease Cas4 (RecB family)